MSVFIRRLGMAARRMRQPVSRRYGSAAAAVDYDYYNCYDEEEEEETQMMMMKHREEEMEGWETPGRGVQWVIMGDPMARRHVYAERLAKLLDVPHISMGSLVRQQELTPNSPLYNKIASAMNQGKLVPEDVIFGLLSKRLEEGYCRGETGFILDGIPRTRMQAEILDQIAEIDLVLNLKCKEEFLMKKTLANGIYSPSNREFHSVANSGVQPEVAVHLQSLNSDSPGTMWEEKLRMYAEQRKPLEEYYKQQKKHIDFQVAAGAPGETWKGLLAALQLQHMSASHKLTA